jgi:hypothetical protein
MLALNTIVGLLLVIAMVLLLFAFPVWWFVIRRR